MIPRRMQWFGKGGLIIGASLFVLLVGLPKAVLEGLGGGTWQAWFGAVCCLFAGIGMAVGARTGRWPFTFGTPG